MDTNQAKQLTDALEVVLISQQDEHDGSHDIHHARRVKTNALEIASMEKRGDSRVLIAAAYLHDLINLPKNHPERDKASTLSAEAAGPVLSKLSFDPQSIKAVQHCIESHSFSANIAPTSIEAKILQDADRLESVGALRIARTFYIAGKMQSSLFHGDDPFALGRALDDKQFAIDHFKVKLLGLADTMQTESGKNIAVKRTQDMREFLNMLASELDVEQPW